MKELKINEEFKNLIPPLTAEEKAELEKSLMLFGCRDKIVTWNGFIIDGHNRYELCTKNNIDFQTLSMDYEFEDQEEVKQWIIKNQFARRNISAYQRSSLALKLKESISKKAKGNQSAAGGDKKSEKAKSLHQKSDKVIEIDEKSFLPELAEQNEQETKNIEEPINTLKEIAKVAGVSHDTIHKVETIENEVIKMFYFRDMTPKEIAKTLGITCQALYERRRWAIKNLRKELEA